MKRHSIFNVAILVSCIFAISEAYALRPPKPIPMLVATSDLIVIGEVIETGEPAQQQVQRPGAKEARPGLYRISKVKVQKTLKGETGNVAKAAKNAEKPQPETISVITPASIPPKPAGRFGVMLVGGPCYLKLKPGKSYALILHKLKGRDEWYLVPHPENIVLTDNDRSNRIKDIETYADIKKWNWGKPVKGLQLALVTPQTVRPHIARIRQGQMQKSARINLTMALRNVTKKDIYINLNPEDRFLNLTAKGPDDQTIEQKLGGARRSVPKTPTTYCIKPGEVFIVGPEGKAKFGVTANMPFAPGQWRLVATLTAKRAEDGDRKDLWTGTLESKPSETEMPSRPTTPAYDAKPLKNK